MHKPSIFPLIVLSSVFFAASLSPATAQVQVTTAAPAAKAPKPAEKLAPKADAPLLPDTFSGWEGQAPTALKDAAQADGAHTAALKEYGFTDGLLREYSRDNETLKIRALRFQDASGAYGAYSFYRQNGWAKEQIGTGAASDHNRVLFWAGNIVIDAQLPHISAMTASELRNLAGQMPSAAGNKSLAPPILSSLPQKDIDGQTTHYALGPAGYTGAGGVLPPELVGFDRGAETATASYKLSSGPATLTLINYPTPQLAQIQEKAIAEYLKAGNTPQHPFTKPLQDSNPTAIEVRRTGPLVAVVSGDPIRDEAHKLLESVHYEADMSAIPGSGPTEVQQFGQLIVGLITLVIVMFVAAVLVAVFLGGGRAFIRRLRGKPASSVYDEEFIRIDLSDV